jgi:hypothetical protein
MVSASGTNATPRVNTTNFSYVNTTVQYINMTPAAASYAGYYANNGAFVGYGASASGTYLGISKASNSFLIDTNGYTLGIGTLGSTPIVFGTNNAERMRIDSSGNVGVGTTSPTYKLHIAHAGSSYGVATTDGTTTSGIYNGVPLGGITGGYIGTVSNNDCVFGAYGASAYLIVKSGGNVGIGTSSPGYKLEVNGSFAATTKSFVIKHPTKEGKKLEHGVVEGPEHSVFVRGKTTSNKIVLPEYWTGLVHEDTITVQLTSIGKHQNLAVVDVNINEITIENQNTFNKNINCYYLVQAERKDIPKLVVEV